MGNFAPSPLEDTMDLQNMTDAALHGLAADLRGRIAAYYQGGTDGKAHLGDVTRLCAVRAELQRRHPGVPALSL